MKLVFKRYLVLTIFFNIAFSISNISYGQIGDLRGDVLDDITDDVAEVQLSSEKPDPALTKAANKAIRRAAKRLEKIRRELERNFAGGTFQSVAEYYIYILRQNEFLDEHNPFLPKRIVGTDINEALKREFELYQDNLQTYIRLQDANIEREIRILFENVQYATLIPAWLLEEVLPYLESKGHISESKLLALGFELLKSRDPNVKKQGIKLLSYIATETQLKSLAAKLLITKRLAQVGGKEAFLTVKELALSEENIMQSDGRSEEVALKFLEYLKESLAKLPEKVIPDQLTTEQMEALRELPTEESEVKVPNPLIVEVHKRLYQAILSANSPAIAEAALRLLPRKVPKYLGETILPRIISRFSVILDLEARADFWGNDFLVIVRQIDMSRVNYYSELTTEETSEDAKNETDTKINRIYIDKVDYGSEFFFSSFVLNKFCDFFEPVNSIGALSGKPNKDQVLEVLLSSSNPEVRKAAHTALISAVINPTSEYGLGILVSREEYTEGFTVAETEAAIEKLTWISKFVEHSPALYVYLALYYDELTYAGAEYVEFKNEIKRLLEQNANKMEDLLRFGLNDLERSQAAVGLILLKRNNMYLEKAMADLLTEIVVLFRSTKDRVAKGMLENAFEMSGLEKSMLTDLASAGFGKPSIKHNIARQISPEVASALEIEAAGESGVKAVKRGFWRRALFWLTGGNGRNGRDKNKTGVGVGVVGTQTIRSATPL